MDNKYIMTFESFKMDSSDKKIMVTKVIGVLRSKFPTMEIKKANSVDFIEADFNFDFQYADNDTVNYAMIKVIGGIGNMLDLPFNITGNQYTFDFYKSYSFTPNENGLYTLRQAIESIFTYIDVKPENMKATLDLVEAEIVRDGGYVKSIVKNNS